MTDIVNRLNGLLVHKFGISEAIAGTLDAGIAVIVLLGAAVGINWICQSVFRGISRHDGRMKRSKWHPFFAKRKLAHHILLLIPGLAFYFMLYIAFERDSSAIRLLHRFDIIYMIIVAMMICNSLLLIFLDIYTTTEKSRNHPMQGLVQGLQVILVFVGSIICIAVLIDKSPKVLLTGLGASAAVLMLIFKDSILGFVAGVQLAQNDMIKIGDWIQMPDGTANGTVEEITLNTVKVRNWDNTISMVPPYTLVSTSFKNWRGMTESGGRRVDKRILLDVRSLEVCSEDMVSDICKNVPLMSGAVASFSGTSASTKSSSFSEAPSNSQLYRIYIERYLRAHPLVAQNLDIIIAQRESTGYGLPVEVYFFITDKVWSNYEHIQSDIFDHLISMAPEFGLKLYQLPS